MSYTCPRCLRTSRHPQDVQNRYCGNCHLFENQIELSSDGPLPIVAVRPVDVSDLPQAGMFQPSVDHVEILCEVCQQPSWIGPTQLALVIAPGAQVMCYRCLIAAAKTNPDVAVALDNVISLDPNADARPRRPE